MKIIHIHSVKIVQLLGVIAILLTISSIAGQFVVYKLHHPRALGIPDIFYLDNEYNIPSYFSTFILGLAAFLLGIIALSEKKGDGHFQKYWIFLAIIFLFFSIDEALSFHEKLSVPLRNLFDWDELVGWKKFFLFTWVVPGLVFSLMLILSYINFFQYLPKKLKFSIFLAALLCFSGVIGMESVSSYYITQHGTLNFTYNLIVTIEETLEMSGTILFIHALFNYINDKELTIQFDKEHH
ncbi:hypothetical protein MUP95_01515 [bacterium]|nr:hypothetical protein [bacterium]